MSKGLEALKQFRFSQYQGVNVYADDLLDIMETALKALEIILNKYKFELIVDENIDTYYLRFMVARDLFVQEEITEEEYYLLRNLAVVNGKGGWELSWK